jgi:hypothetical protein
LQETTSSNKSNKNPVINIKKEQSEIQQMIEELRQLILSSSIRSDRILRIDATLDVLSLNISNYYQDKINSIDEIGNI